MQHAELFLSLAEIAGVFVGFGALIAVRSGGSARPAEVLFVSLLVLTGVQAIAMALVPVVIGGFDIPGHAVWASCSIVALAVFWVGQWVHERFSPERRAYISAAGLGARGRREWEVVGAVFWLPMTVALALIVLGPVPDLEAALYVAAVVLIVLMDAELLLAMVTMGAPAWRPSPGDEKATNVG